MDEDGPPRSLIRYASHDPRVCASSRSVVVSCLLVAAVHDWSHMHHCAAAMANAQDPNVGDRDELTTVSEFLQNQVDRLTKLCRGKMEASVQSFLRSGNASVSGPAVGAMNVAKNASQWTTPVESAAVANQ